MPRLYDLTWTKPPVLIERHLRMTVEERIDAGGHVQVPLARAEAEAAVDRLLAEEVEAIAVCLVHSYANPAHEKMIQEIVREKAPDLPLCISFDVLPEIKEYERTSTTVINSYVLPIVARYLEVLRADLDAAGITAQLLLMQSNGGLIPDETARVKPMNIIESGPAGGVVGAQAVARRSGIPNVITFDMGGTTAKASMIENGSFTRALDYQVGGGIMMGSRLLTGSGYLLKVPAIDLAEVGAGGGSIVWIDAGGALQIGPESAGAAPGPLCYDIGGMDPDGDRRQRVARLSQPRISGQRGAATQCRACTYDLRRYHRDTVEDDGRGRGLWRAPHRGIEHDPRDPLGFDGARS